MYITPTNIAVESIIRAQSQEYFGTPLVHKVNSSPLHQGYKCNQFNSHSQLPSCTSELIVLLSLVISYSFLVMIDSKFPVPSTLQS